MAPNMQAPEMIVSVAMVRKLAMEPPCEPEPRLAPSVRRARGRRGSIKVNQDNHDRVKQKGRRSRRPSNTLWNRGLGLLNAGEQPLAAARPHEGPYLGDLLRGFAAVDQPAARAIEKAVH